MKLKFSSSWKSSMHPRKQRKFRANAPLHIHTSFVGVHLSKDLKQKIGKRAMPAREGDTVKVIRGQHKGKTGKIRSVNRKFERIIIEGVEQPKRDGSKVPVPVHPSNLVLIDLVPDKKRQKRSEKK
ncbi:MAG TPA: 50S ribosomal protein L24 [Candidatus Nanoarchaeia archaeon]|nr:50S ribosomal protein L24 [Candidatus Nanoarchaeia archaeon]